VPTVESNQFEVTPYQDLLKDVSFDEVVQHVEQSLTGMYRVISLLKKTASAEEAHGKSLLHLASESDSGSTGAVGNDQEHPMQCCTP